jgi:hypothetical protein
MSDTTPETAMISAPPTERLLEAENVEIPAYLNSAKNLAETAHDLDMSQRLDLMTGFLDGISAAAENGEIVGSGDRVYTAEMFEDQLIEFLDAMNKPKDEDNDPYDFITRTDGLRKAFIELITNDDTGEALLKAIEMKKGQEMLKNGIQGLGKEAVEATGVSEPVIPDLEKMMDPEGALKKAEADIKALTDTLSPSDKIAVWKYATAIKDFELGNALDAMSDAVKANRIHIKYKDLFVRIHELRSE